METIVLSALALGLVLLAPVDPTSEPVPDVSVTVTAEPTTTPPTTAPTTKPPTTKPTTTPPTTKPTVKPTTKTPKPTTVRPRPTATTKSTKKPAAPGYSQAPPVLTPGYRPTSTSPGRLSPRATTDGGSSERSSEANAELPTVASPSPAGGTGGLGGRRPNGSNLAFLLLGGLLACITGIIIAMWWVYRRSVR